MKLLEEVKSDSPNFITANRLLKFLKYFIPITDKWIPCNSIIREFIGNSFGYTYAVVNNTVYWVASEENTAKIYAFDIESKKESFIADIDPVNGVHRLAAENGYLIYTVGKFNDMGNNASDYIFDLNTGTSTLISDYHVAQF